ncbi:MAG TPA: lysophospholipid acyltransferase family protein [Planctomycetota bacterium]
MDPRGLRQARREALARRDAERTAAGRNTQALVLWRRCRRRVGNWLLEWLGPAMLRLLAMTWRVQRRGDSGWQLLASEQPWLVAMWHGRMLVGLPMRMHRSRKIGVLVSPSDDGNLATRALRLFGYVSIRGSLSRQGARALREMTETLQAGRQLVVTPDGPRGPRHSMNVGMHWLARRTGAPILPVAFACDRAWRLRSWDRFTIPKPFARIVVHYGDPCPIAATASDSELEVLAAELGRRLVAMEREAFATLGTAPDFEEPAASS